MALPGPIQGALRSVGRVVGRMQGPVSVGGPEGPKIALNELATKPAQVGSEAAASPAQTGLAEVAEQAGATDPKAGLEALAKADIKGPIEGLHEEVGAWTDADVDRYAPGAKTVEQAAQSTTETPTQPQIPEDLRENADFLSLVKKDALEKGVIDVDQAAERFRTENNARENIQELFKEWGTTDGRIDPNIRQADTENAIPLEKQAALRQTQLDLESAQQDPLYRDIEQQLLQEGAFTGREQNRAFRIQETFTRYKVAKAMEARAAQGINTGINIPTEFKGEADFIDKALEGMKTGTVDLEKMAKDIKEAQVQQQEALEKAEQVAQAQREEEALQNQAEVWAEDIIKKLYGNTYTRTNEPVTEFDAIKDDPAYKEMFAKVDKEMEESIRGGSLRPLEKETLIRYKIEKLKQEKATSETQPKAAEPTPPTQPLDETAPLDAGEYYQNGAKPQPSPTEGGGGSAVQPTVESPQTAVATAKRPPEQVAATPEADTRVQRLETENQELRDGMQKLEERVKDLEAKPAINGALEQLISVLAANPDIIAKLQKAMEDQKALPPEKRKGALQLVLEALIQAMGFAIVAGTQKQ